jgi:tetratricopeptide (TPR) repeat protein
LAKPEEAAPSAETAEPLVEIPEPEVLVPTKAVAEPVLMAEKIPAEAVEPAPVEQPEPEPVEVMMEPDPAEAILTDARNALNQDQPSQAVTLYSGLVKQNYRLDEIIKDLQEAIYRFPVDVDMWVTLGDAHSHTHDLQEALNAYTKAEELAR